MNPHCSSWPFLLTFTPSLPCCLQNCNAVSMAKHPLWKVKKKKERKTRYPKPHRSGLSAGLSLFIATRIVRRRDNNHDTQLPRISATDPSAPSGNSPRARGIQDRSLPSEGIPCGPRLVLMLKQGSSPQRPGLCDNFNFVGPKAKTWYCSHRVRGTPNRSWPRRRTRRRAFRIPSASRWRNSCPASL